MKRFAILFLLIASPLLAQVPGTERIESPPPPPEPMALALPASGVPSIKTGGSVPVYELVKIDVGPAAAPKDVMVMAVIQNEVRFIEVVETVGGQFVFTGPPGRYSIRVTVSQEGRGFAYATGSVTIAGATTSEPPRPVPPPDAPPPEPVDPGPFPDGASKPPPEGMYGFGPLVYGEAMKIRHKQQANLVRLAENFEWAATAEIGTLDELIAKLAEKNKPLYSPMSDWQSYRNAWAAQATRLTENGILPQTVEDNRIMFKETAAGIRAALK